MKLRLVISALAVGILAASSAFAQQDLGTDDVRQVQRALNEAGYNAGPVDGRWGLATADALRAFQEDKGLTPTGQVDDRTILALGFSLSDFPAGDYEVQPRLSQTEVREIQRALNEAGYDAGRVDGRWGPSTERALHDFQEAKGLDPTGRLNEKTILALGLSLSDFAANQAAEPGNLGREEIQQVQRALNDAGYDVGPVTGRWDPETERALRDFQKDKGLDPTGRLDDRTILSLGFSLSEFAAGEFARPRDDRSEPIQ